MLDETTIEEVRIDDLKDVGKGLSTRNSVRQSEPFLKPLDIFKAEFFDLGEAVHAAESGGNDHEKDFSKVVFFVSIGSGIFDHEEGFKACGQPAGIVDLIRISRHLGIVHIPDIAYRLKFRKSLQDKAVSLA